MLIDGAVLYADFQAKYRTAFFKMSRASWVRRRCAAQSQNLALGFYQIRRLLLGIIWCDRFKPFIETMSRYANPGSHFSRGVPALD